MINPEDIVFKENLNPSEAREYILSLESSYILKGKRKCDEMVYLAAIRAIYVVKENDTDSHTIDVANSFLLNTGVRAIAKSELKKLYIQSLLKERDSLVQKDPAAQRPTVFHLLIPFQGRQFPRGLEIGMFSTFEKAELALQNLVQDPITILEGGYRASYIISQEVMDCYKHQPEQALLYVWKYNKQGELLCEWFNNYEYNINGTIKWDLEKEALLETIP